MARPNLSFERDFRWRGEQVSRIEAFSDAVFAFAITLLIASLEVPTSFADLAAALWRFPGFAISFLLLLFIWYFHYLFFRRYGLQDNVVLWLNAGLLFVVLFYVYPLRFLWALLAAVAGGSGSWEALNWDQWTTLMVIYAAGMMAVYSLLALMGRHALAKAEALELDPLEVHLTREMIQIHVILIGAGALSVLLAVALPQPWNVPAAGWVYFLLFPAQYLHARSSGRVTERLRAEREAASA